jgi:hypothetical protein
VTSFSNSRARSAIDANLRATAEKGGVTGNRVMPIGRRGKRAPAATTKVRPASLRKNTLPLQAHGEEANAVAAGSIRVVEVTFPVVAVDWLGATSYAKAK